MNEDEAYKQTFEYAARKLGESIRELAVSIHESFSQRIRKQHYLGDKRKRRLRRINKRNVIRGRDMKKTYAVLDYILNGGEMPDCLRR